MKNRLTFYCGAYIMLCRIHKGDEKVGIFPISSPRDCVHRLEDAKKMKNVHFTLEPLF